jgi:6-pyruvoyl-tetrahydropterin synthase
VSAILYLNHFIAIGQKTKASSSGFGEGHNYMVEVGVAVQGALQVEVVKAKIGAVLNEIDHKALGVDVDLGVEPETSMLPKWIFERLRKSGLSEIREVRMNRGDGMTASYLVQPSDGKSA